MLFNKSLTVNGIPCASHKVTRVELEANGSAVNMWLQSWATEQARLDGFAAAGQSFITCPTPPDLIAQLVSLVQGSDAFSGAMLVPDLVGDLDNLKSRRWAEMKAVRAAAEFGGFDWNGVRFDSDPQSQSYIQGAVQMAAMASAQSQPFLITWTLADNTTRDLSGIDMIAVGMALAAHVESVHQKGRAVRAAIEAATTAEELQAIAWPA